MQPFFAYCKKNTLWMKERQFFTMWLIHRFRVYDWTKIKNQKNLKKFQKRGCQNFKPMVLYTSAKEIRRERKTKWWSSGVVVNMPPCHGGDRGFESHLDRHFCRCSSMVEHSLAKADTGVQFPSSAPLKLNLYKDLQRSFFVADEGNIKGKVCSTILIRLADQDGPSPRFT